MIETTERVLHRREIYESFDQEGSLLLETFGFNIELPLVCSSFRRFPKETDFLMKYLRSCLFFFKANLIFPFPVSSFPFSLVTL